MKKILCLIIALLLSELTAKTVASSNVKVVDGDSLEINTRRIRLLGIDAPELFQECFDKKGQTYMCGQEAKDYLQKLIETEQNKGEKLKCRAEAVDRYKRDLSICKIGKINLNLEMIKNGLAVAYKEDMFQAAQNKAKKAQKGIWQGKFMRPELYRTLKREQEKQKKQ